MALDRTLLAWVRTSASLIGFGFAIYQFFELLNKTPGVLPPGLPPPPGCSAFRWLESERSLSGWL